MDAEEGRAGLWISVPWSRCAELQRWSKWLFWESTGHSGMLRRGNSPVHLYLSYTTQAMSALVLICRGFWSMPGKGWRRKEKLSPSSSESELVAPEKKLQGKMLQANLLSLAAESQLLPTPGLRTMNARSLPVFWIHLSTGDGGMQFCCQGLEGCQLLIFFCGK